METVKNYVDSLPEDRQKAIKKIRSIVRKNLPKGYIEACNSGMICYEVPLKKFPDTYNGKPLMYAALASQKNHMALYLTSVYADEELRSWFVDSYKKSGKKLDMGKSCVRFKKLEDVPTDLIGEAIASTSVDDFIEIYHKSRS